MEDLIDTSRFTFTVTCYGLSMKVFDLHFKSRGDKYIVVLIPRVSKSIERFNLAYQIRTGFPPPTDAQYNIIFKPIHFSAKSGQAFEKIKGLLRSESVLGLIDPADFNPAEPVDNDKVHDLGVFRIASNKGMDEYLDGLFDISEG